MPNDVIHVTWTVPQPVALYILNTIKKRPMEECEEVVGLLQRQMQVQLQEAMRSRLAPSEETPPADDAKQVARAALQDVQDRARQANGASTKER